MANRSPHSDHADRDSQADRSQPFEGTTGSPFAPTDDPEAMLAAIGAEDLEDLFDIPASLRFEESLGIESRPERDVLRKLTNTLSRNDSLTEFLGRGHYEHAVPSVVDHLADRSEFLTSYTQYQPEVTQGFLQALFEYQSLLVELTGLPVANCSMYDAATALGEAATLASRVRDGEGSTILVPSYLRQEHREVLENYTSGTDLTVESFRTADGMVDPETLDTALSEDVAMVYAENPTVEGVIEEHLSEVGRLADEHGALFCLGSDTVALSLLEEPAAVGADIVIGDASVLGLPAANGMGLGLFACREDFLRQVPGRLVGATEDQNGTRAYTLTLQTREQHIRRERATSNICTNQAWVALRAAAHAAYLGPDGLLSVAEQCHRRAEALADRLDDIEGVDAPVRDCHHFREFKMRVDPDAERLAATLQDHGLAVHVLNTDELQVCVTEANEHQVDDLVSAVAEVLG
jgi:glycine dehydrogenase subunit 1